MDPIVSDDVAMDHVKVDAMDSALRLYLSAATDAAIAFLNRNVYATQDELDQAVADDQAGCDPIIANDSIRIAILLIFGHLCANREDTYVGPGIAVQMPRGAERFLWPYRRGLGV
jgi:hypothetical protein